MPNSKQMGSWKVLIIWLESNPGQHIARELKHAKLHPAYLPDQRTEQNTKPFPLWKLPEIVIAVGGEMERFYRHHHQARVVKTTPIRTAARATNCFY